MRALQIHLNLCWDRMSMPRDAPVPHSPALLRDLDWWSREEHLLQGQPLEGVTTPDLLLHSDASFDGWGVSLLDLHAAGTWSDEEREASINLLELRAIRLGLQHFSHTLQGRSVGLLSDNTSAIAYIKKEGGTRSPKLNAEVQCILQCAED